MAKIKFSFSYEKFSAECARRRISVEQISKDIFQESGSSKGWKESKSMLGPQEILKISLMLNVPFINLLERTDCGYLEFEDIGQRFEPGHKSRDESLTLGTKAVLEVIVKSY